MRRWVLFALVACVAAALPPPPPPHLPPLPPSPPPPYLPPQPPSPPQPPDSPERFTLTDTDVTSDDTTATLMDRPVNVEWPMYHTTDHVTYANTKVCGVPPPNGDMGIASKTNPHVTAAMTDPIYTGVDLAFQCDIVTPYASHISQANNLGFQSCEGDTVTISFVPGSIPAGVDNLDLKLYVFFNKPTSSYHYISSTKDNVHMIKAFGNAQNPGDPSWSNSPTFVFDVSSHFFQELPWAATDAAYVKLSPKGYGLGLFLQVYTSCGMYSSGNFSLDPPTLGSELGNCGGQLEFTYTRNIVVGGAVPVCFVHSPPPMPPSPARPPPPMATPPEPPQAPSAPKAPPIPPIVPKSPPPPTQSPPPHPTSDFLKSAGVRAPRAPGYPEYPISPPPTPPNPPRPPNPPGPPPAALVPGERFNCEPIVYAVCKACNGRIMTNKCQCVCPLTHLESVIVSFGVFILIALIQFTL
jgi:hypothetical protein